MTTHTRMMPRNQREKDLLKYGRRQGRKQERERIVSLIVEKTYDSASGNSLSWIMDASNIEQRELIALIEGEDF